MRDLREDNALCLVIVADSTEILHHLGKLQSLRLLRTANRHQGMNKCKKREKGQDCKKTKGNDKTRERETEQKQDLQKKENYSKRESKQSRKDLQKTFSCN